MNTNTKLKWLGGLLGLCAISIAVESYFLWHVEKSGLAAKQLDNGLTFSSTLPQAPNPWAGGWNPNAQFKQMQQQMDRLMNQMSTASSMFSQQGFASSQASPTISMQDEPGKYQVVVDVPKGQKVEINTNLSSNQLTIDGKVKQTSENKSSNGDLQSLSVSQFSQTMNFPEPIQDSGVKVRRHDHQIVITVPKVG